MEEKKDDLMNVISELSKKLDEKASNDLAKLTEIEEKMDSLKPEPKAEEWSEEEEEAPVTRAELKKILSGVDQLVEKKAHEISKKIVEEKTTQNTTDAKAMSDFPWANQQSDKFNPKFFDEVKKEVSGRVQRGRKQDDPDLLYDAAAAVYRRMSGTLTKEDAQREVDLENRRGENFDVRKRPADDPSKPNDFQIELAKQFNLKAESLAQHLERTKKSA